MSVPISGGPPQGPRLDSHWGETLPLSHLRHPLPPPADPEKPPAHPHRREALLCKWQKHHPIKHRENQTVTTLSHLINARFTSLLPSAKSATFTSDTRASCVFTCARSTEPSPTPRSATRC